MHRIFALVLVNVIAGCGSGQLEGMGSAGSGGNGARGGSGGTPAGLDAGSDTVDAGDQARACGASGSFASIGIRAELPAGTPAPTPFMDPSSLIFDVQGMVTRVARTDEPSIRIEVMDGAGKPWAVVVSPQGALAEWEAAAESIRGRAISLRIAYRHGFQLYVAFGFTIHDDAGLVMASDGGQYVQALTAADTPSLVVTKGAPICREGDRCRVFQELSFAGTTTVNVGVTDGEVTIGSRRYGVRNQGARTLEVACRGSDSEEASPWSIWLRP